MSPKPPFTPSGSAYGRSQLPLAMDKLKSLQTDLKAAQDALTALQDELPQFHALLTDNEGDAQRLKSERASLDAQAQARGRVQIAKEMLEQHQSDIATARAEVNRLEAALDRERTLLKMVDQAKTAKQYREELDKAFITVVAAVHKASEGITKAWQAENEARRSFAETGSQLVPQIRNLNGRHYFREAEKALVEALERDLEARGAPLEAVSDGATGSFTYLDGYAKRELPRDELSVLLWEAIRLLTKADPEAHNLRRLTPATANPYAVYIPAPNLPKGL